MAFGLAPMLPCQCRQTLWHVPLVPLFASARHPAGFADVVVSLFGVEVARLRPVAPKLPALGALTLLLIAGMYLMGRS